MNGLYVAALAATTVIASPAAAALVTIDFDDGTAGAAVGSAYAAAGATFSNGSYSSNFGLPGTSGALGLVSTRYGALFGPDAPIVITFSEIVTKVSLTAFSVGQAGIRVEAFDAANQLLAFDQKFPGAADNVTRDLSVSASAIAGVRLFQPFTRFGSNSAGDGVLLDNLSFVTAPVPEPTTWAMLTVGFAAVGAALRRRPAVRARVRVG